MDVAVAICAKLFAWVLSVLAGMGLAWLGLRSTGWSEGLQEFWFLIMAFAISIPLNWLFHRILERLIGKPEV